MAPPRHLPPERDQKQRPFSEKGRCVPSARPGTGSSPVAYLVALRCEYFRAVVVDLNRRRPRRISLELGGGSDTQIETPVLNASHMP